MANDAAWQAGVDIAQKKKSDNKSKKDSWGNFGQPQKPKESGWKKFLHIASPISNLHSGGRVKRTGNYRLRKGELVLTVSQQKEYGLKKKTSKKSSRKRVGSKG